MVRKEAGRYISTAERREIIKKLNTYNPQLVNVVQLLFKTGIRIGELEQYLMAVKTANNGDEFVIITPLKHNNKRQIPIFAEAKALLMLKDRKTASIRKAIQRANEELKLNFSPHDARHTLFTNAAREAPNLFALMAMTGHNKPDSVMKYVHLAEIDNSQLYKHGFDPTHYDRNEDYFEAYKAERNEKEKLQNKLDNKRRKK